MRPPYVLGWVVPSDLVRVLVFPPVRAWDPSLLWSEAHILVDALTRLTPLWGNLEGWRLLSQIIPVWVPSGLIAEAEADSGVAAPFTPDSGCLS